MDKALGLNVGDDVARGALDRVPLLADDDPELLRLPLPQPQHLEGLGWSWRSWQLGARAWGTRLTGLCYKEMTAMLTSVMTIQG